MNSKLHAVADGSGKPIILVLSEGQLSDHLGAKLVYPALPNADVLIGDKGYDSDELRCPYGQEHNSLHSAKVEPKRPASIFKNPV